VLPSWVRLLKAKAPLLSLHPHPRRAAATLPARIHPAPRNSFQILSYHVPVFFTLLRGCFGPGAVAAQSPPVAVANPNAPTQIRLALTGYEESMRVTWSTQEAGAPVVRWGTAPGQYLSKASGTSSTYTAADLCAEPANGMGWKTPGMINTALMTGLQPNTRYYYVVGDPVRGPGPHMVVCCVIIFFRSVFQSKPLGS